MRRRRHLQLNDGASDYAGNVLLLETARTRSRETSARVKHSFVRANTRACAFSCLRVFAALSDKFFRARPPFVSVLRLSVWRFPFAFLALICLRSSLSPFHFSFRIPPSRVAIVQKVIYNPSPLPRWSYIPQDYENKRGPIFHAAQWKRSPERNLLLFAFRASF